ncbi:carboxypeptidase regulatory-like domain-containing protein [Paludibaculum fermentans]|uniref:carboxypeptidase-like regulatory domain-containing protein n=1 Tax=Paludibaculum fermentans TaxID=1473598 RepID=UPI003EBEBCB5
MRLIWLLILVRVLTPACFGQTTQGIISGQIRKGETTQGIAGATVSFDSQDLALRGAAISASDGSYRLPPLPPGRYHLRVEVKDYRPQDYYELEVRVAGRLVLDFQLQELADVWGDRFGRLRMPGSEYLATLYGPDLRMQTTVMVNEVGEQGAPDAALSQSIDPAQIKELPLAGRDVYTVLVTQPGITAEAGTTRSLGVAVNGQRPTASNFLLDGIEVNNQLLSGPALIIAPEVVQEYRISTADFSAETGGTSGYTANAITRSGGDAVHGTAYLNLKNEAFNANSLQNNRLGLRRPVSREIQPGVQLAGRLWKRLVYGSASWEHLDSHGHSPATEVSVPSPLLTEITFATSDARKLLTAYPSPAVQSGRDLTSHLWFEPPVTVQRTLGTVRLDLIPGGGKHRAMARAAVAASSRPDFVWSPYSEFQSGLKQSVSSSGFTVASLVSPRFFNEARVGFLADNLGWSRPHPEVPTLVDTSFESTILPGSLAFYSFSNRIRSLQVQDGASWSPGRHTLKAGGGLTSRQLGGFLSAGQDGRYSFPTVVDFAVDQPAYFSVSLDRLKLPSLAQPDSRRSYNVRDYLAFVQDSWQASRRLTLNMGVRYERFGSPVNTGPVKDLVVQLGRGTTLAERLQGAVLDPGPAGSQPLFQSASTSLSLRVGAALDVTGGGNTVLRAGWGQFRDRPYDNLWLNLRNNRFVLANFDYEPAAGSYLRPVEAVLPAYRRQAVDGDFPYLTQFDSGWSSGSSESRFAGLQRRISGGWVLDAAYLGSSGRRLASTDIVNRPFSVRPGQGAPDGSLNPALPQISYRANQGSSSYHGLTLAAARRSDSGQLHVAYTWGHSIDNQSDPIAGDFFDLNFARVSASPGVRQIAAFSRQFDPAADRGNSDFDQRQSLVFYYMWDVPAVRGTGALLRDWKLAQLGAVRSGFPYSVLAASSVPDSGGITYNSRADLLDPDGASTDSPSDGGRQILNSAAFRSPANGRLGSAGRNAFSSPGFFSLDLSLSRFVPLPLLGEAGRLTFRADAFNVLNHANLNRPDSLLGSPTFGQALFGRTGLDSGFPVSTPFRETAREFQILLRIGF